MKNQSDLSIIDCFREYSAEYYNKLFMARVDQSTTYRKAREKRFATSDALHDELMDDDSPLHHYLDAIYDVTCMEYDYLYQQGYRDCIALLRVLGVIPNV